MSWPIRCPISKSIVKARFGPCLRVSVPRHQYSTEDDLYRSVRDAAIDRGLQILFVDEASALVKAGHARTLRDQLDVLRNLADLGVFRVVLVSTPRLLKGLDASSELLGRVDEVFFGRYRPDAASDFRSFVRIVKSFMNTLPEPSRFAPTALEVRELHRGSFGAVGHLSRWFSRAVRRCLSNGDVALRWAHFEATILPRKKLNDLDKHFTQDDSVIAEWDDRACVAPRSRRVASNASETSPEASSKPSTKRDRGGNRGQKPTRKAVG